MFNTFPDLLTYSFFAPTLLRLAGALAVAYIAYAQFKRREEIGEITYWLIGKPGSWLIWVVVALETILALALLFGYYTQLAALAGLVLCVKHYIFAKKYSRAIPLCRVDYIFLAVILLSLLLTGAGALAIDLPL